MTRIDYSDGGNGMLIFASKQNIDKKEKNNMDSIIKVLGTDVKLENVSLYQIDDYNYHEDEKLDFVESKSEDRTVETKYFYNEIDRLFAASTKFKESGPVKMKSKKKTKSEVVTTRFIYNKDGSIRGRAILNEETKEYTVIREKKLANGNCRITTKTTNERGENSKTIEEYDPDNNLVSNKKYVNDILIFEFSKSCNKDGSITEINIDVLKKIMGRHRYYEIDSEKISLDSYITSLETKNNEDGITIGVIGSGVLRDKSTGRIKEISSTSILTGERTFVSIEYDSDGRLIKITDNIPSINKTQPRIEIKYSSVGKVVTRYTIDGQKTVTIHQKRDSETPCHFTVDYGNMGNDSLVLHYTSSKLFSMCYGFSRSYNNAKMSKLSILSDNQEFSMAYDGTSLAIINTVREKGKIIKEESYNLSEEQSATIKYIEIISIIFNKLGIKREAIDPFESKTIGKWLRESMVDDAIIPGGKEQIYPESNIIKFDKTN